MELLVWNDSGEEHFSDSDNVFSDFEENSGANENDENINSHDSGRVGTEFSIGLTAKGLSCNI